MVKFLKIGSSRSVRFRIVLIGVMKSAFVGRLSRMVTLPQYLPMRSTTPSAILETLSDFCPRITSSFMVGDCEDDESGLRKKLTRSSVA